MVINKMERGGGTVPTFLMFKNKGHPHSGVFYLFWWVYFLWMEMIRGYKHKC